MTDEDCGLWKAWRGMSNGGRAVFMYGLDSVDPPRLGNCIPPSGPKLGVGRVGSWTLPKGGSFIPPLGAIEGEKSGASSPSRIAESGPYAGVPGTMLSFPPRSLARVRNGRDATARRGVSGIGCDGGLRESVVEIVKPSLLRRGGCIEGPIKEGDDGSENGRAAESLPPCGWPAGATWLGMAVESILELATAGKEDVLLSPCLEKAEAKAVCGACLVLMPVVLIDRFLVFRGLLFGDPALSSWRVGEGVRERLPECSIVGLRGVWFGSFCLLRDGNNKFGDSGDELGDGSVRVESTVETVIVGEGSVDSDLAVAVDVRRACELDSAPW